MKNKILKAIACLSLTMMVLSAVAPGAFADDNETTNASVNDSGDFKLERGAHGGPGMDSEGPEAMEFESDEEEFEFLVERANESVTKRIEMLNDMLANIDEIGDENVTEESVQEQISEMETLQESILSATTLDEIKEIMEEARDSMMPAMMKGGEKPEMEEMEFESDEEEFDYLVERETESISNKLEKLNDMLANIDEIGDENVTEDSIQEHIDELEALQENIDNATTLEELKDILEEYRENHPHGHGGKFCGPMDNSSEEVTAE